MWLMTGFVPVEINSDLKGPCSQPSISNGDREPQTVGINAAPTGLKMVTQDLCLEVRGEPRTKHN